MTTYLHLQNAWQWRQTRNITEMPFGSFKSFDSSISLEMFHSVSTWNIWSGGATDQNCSKRSDSLCQHNHRESRHWWTHAHVQVKCKRKKKDSKNLLLIELSLQCPPVSFTSSWQWTQTSTIHQSQATTNYCHIVVTMNATRVVVSKLQMTGTAAETSGIVRTASITWITPFETETSGTVTIVPLLLM